MVLPTADGCFWTHEALWRNGQRIGLLAKNTQEVIQRLWVRVPPESGFYYFYSSDNDKHLSFNDISRIFFKIFLVFPPGAFYAQVENVNKSGGWKQTLK